MNESVMDNVFDTSCMLAGRCSLISLSTSLSTISAIETVNHAFDCIGWMIVSATD